MKLEQILEQVSIEESIAAILLASVYSENLNENLTEAKAQQALDKLGLTVTKTKGIVDYVRSFVKGSGRIIIAAVKGDKQKVREIASTLKKEDVMDFILKLDMATMHLVSGPIHFIDAITGWDLWANVKHNATKANSTYQEISSVLFQLKSKINSFISEPKKSQMLEPIDSLISMLGKPNA
jgi:hypothetical protein